MFVTILPRYRYKPTFSISPSFNGGETRYVRLWIFTIISSNFLLNERNTAGRYIHKYIVIVRAHRIGYFRFKCTEYDLQYRYLPIIIHVFTRHKYRNDGKLRVWSSYYIVYCVFRFDGQDGFIPSSSSLWLPRPSVSPARKALT